MKFIPRKVDSQFLIRVIRNEVSSEEREYFEQWRAESDSNKEEYGNLLLIWDQMGKSNLPAVPDPELQWRKISAKITDTEKKSFSIKSAELSHDYYIRPNWGIWILRAAAVVVISVLSIIAYNQLPSYEEQAVDHAAQSTIPADTTKFNLIAEKAQKITFRLSDGSIIYLNSDTKLIYPKYFANDCREVEIFGEAYFSVKSDIEKPFKVKCGEITTLVTGTEFNVINRNSRVEVVVSSGSVKVSSGNSDRVVQLKKGEKVSANSGKINKPFSVDLKYELAWRENKFAFSNTPLKEIMDQIERYYNVKVVFKNDSVKTRSLTGMFETKSLDQILSLLNLTLDLNIRQQGFSVIVE